MSVNNDEILSLLSNKSKPQSKKLTKLSSTFKLINALPNGASSLAATFGPIAVYYKPGLWLIAPVATGGIVSVSDEAIQLLSKKYPKNQFLKSLSDKLFLIDQGVGGFFADFGFAWNSLLTASVFVGGIQYSTNSFAKMIAPAAALVPALVTRKINYRKAKNELVERSKTRHVAELLNGLTAPGNVLGILLQQQILSENSPIPMATIMGMGLMGLFSSILKETHPKVSKVLLSLIDLFGNNPSLAAAFFLFPNNIYAAVNEDEISDEFFFGNLAFANLYLLMLTTLTLITAAMPAESVSLEEESDLEAGFYDSDEVESLLKSDSSDSEEEDESAIPFEEVREEESEELGVEESEDMADTLPANSGLTEELIVQDSSPKQFYFPFFQYPQTEREGSLHAEEEESFHI